MSTIRSYPTYRERLRDPRWQQRRLEIMDRDKHPSGRFMCAECCNKDETLNVHHRYYRKGVEPWDYPDEALVTLCETCHEGVTAMTAFIAESTGTSMARQKEVINYIIASSPSGRISALREAMWGVNRIVDAVIEIGNLNRRLAGTDPSPSVKARHRALCAELDELVEKTGIGFQTAARFAKTSARPEGQE